jgi:hypothetical protein
MNLRYFDQAQRVITSDRAGGASVETAIDGHCLR